MLRSLADRLPPPEAVAKGVDEICSLAVARGVRILVDAEQTAVQEGIDRWTLAYMRKYNTTPDQPIVYATFQAYLKRTPQNLRSHLDIARKEGFTLGVKLVRGAYLATDPRHLIHDTKADTDRAFHDLASSLLLHQWTDRMPGSGPFPSLALVMATHNAESVSHARRIVESGQAKVPVVFAQLQGMADEVSYSLVAQPGPDRDVDKGTKPKLGVYKYLAWGSTTDCMKYLVRRAEENRDAVERTRDSHDSMKKELLRRIRAAIGLGAS